MWLRGIHHDQAGEGNGKARTHAWLTFDGHFAIVLSNDRFDNCQPQAIALDLTVTVVADTVKAVKDEGQAGGGNSITGVPDFDP